jgi:erythromycin esterase
MRKKFFPVYLSIVLSLLLISLCKPRHENGKPPADSFDQWAKANAVPIVTTLPGSGYKDLSILKEIVGNAKVVALGESIHMAHEFIQMRHRIIEYLIEELGFTAVAQETGFSEAEMVHKYVLGQIEEPRQWTEDPEKIDAEGYTWGFGKEKEQLALVRWMRNYNQKPEVVRKINFYGFDVAHGYSSPLTSLQSAWKYLDKVDSAYKNSERKKILESQVGKFLGSGGGLRFVSTKKYHELPENIQNAYKAEIARLIAHFEINQVDYIKRSSKEEYEWAYRHAVAARQLNQSTEYLIDVLKSGNWEKAQRSRDYCQADNICWILDREGPEGRVVVTAHNSHIQRHTVYNPNWSPHPYPPLGLFLQSRLGGDYVVIGFTFERAVDIFKAYETNGRFDLSQTDESSIGSALSSVALPMFIINLRAAPNKGPVHDWLNRERPMIAETDYIPVNISKAWDALVYIQAISYAHR